MSANQRPKPRQKRGHSIQGLDIPLLTRVILCAMNRLIDDLEDDKLSQEMDLDDWVKDFVQNHVWDI